MTIKVLVIGGGFAGCSVTHLLSELDGIEIDLVEKNNYLGAGNKTRWYGGHPYTFGPRHFLTPYENVFQYLNDIIPINLCPEHEFLSYVPQDNDFYAYPINMDDIKRMPDYSQISEQLKTCRQEISAPGAVKASNLEEYWLQSVGKNLYEKLIRPYNQKMWLIDDVTDIDTFKWSPKGVTIKEGSKAAWDNVFSGYPYAKNGYDDYFPFATSKANVYLNTDIENIDWASKCVSIVGNKKCYDIIVNTIGVDTLFNNCHGDLPYLGRQLELIVLPVKQAFPGNVYFLYYTGPERFTRLVEYKKFTKHEDPNTLIGMEIPALNGGKEYPMPFKWAQRKAQNYMNLLPRNAFTMGRAGSYLYGIDIDDCIRQAMYVKECISSGSWDGPVPCSDYRFPELDDA